MSRNHNHVSGARIVCLIPWYLNFVSYLSNYHQITTLNVSQFLVDFCSVTISICYTNKTCFQLWDVIRGYFAHQSMLRPPSSSSLPPGAGGPPHLTGRGILLSNRLCKENFRSQVIFIGTILSDAFIGWPCTQTFFFFWKSAIQGSVLHLKTNNKWKWFLLSVSEEGDNPWLENFDPPKVDFISV